MELVFATNNQNKIKEIEAILPKEIKILSLKDIGCLEDIPETSPTIEGNAIQKVNYITKKYGMPCFADDSGLEIDFLNGAPGVFSARYAGLEKDPTKNNLKVLNELKGQINRKAQFKTVIALQLPNELKLFTGIVKGEITNEMFGNKGFGYDPIFIPEGHTETFAMLSLEIKNKISHRGIATKYLIEFLKDNKYLIINS